MLYHSAEPITLIRRQDEGTAQQPVPGPDCVYIIISRSRGEKKDQSPVQWHTGCVHMNYQLFLKPLLITPFQPIRNCSMDLVLQMPNELREGVPQQVNAASTCEALSLIPSTGGREGNQYLKLCLLYNVDKHSNRNLTPVIFWNFKMRQNSLINAWGGEIRQTEP